GVPLATSTAQHRLFIDRLLISIRNGCYLHQQRQLSVHGRATFLSTFLLSRLWYVLRLTVTDTSASSFKYVTERHIQLYLAPQVSPNRHIPSPATIATGGLQVLDPRAQHQALQLRWIQPLVDYPNANTLGSLVILYLAHHLLCITSNLPIIASYSPSLKHALVFYSNNLRQ
ncbi:hypothetical protein BDB00DRAFT_777624, partial [Zychaea mexicana]|uniref:uncharacterized protein n=1 Tax=Zychaea mexicana TaxID=64656 RepID=UPI0022FF0C63